jgi:quinoprotein glucose dehydrogenase
MSARTFIASMLGAALLLAAGSQYALSEDWPVYNGDKAGTHYSPLTQIDRSNVTRLQEVWRFEGGGTGETQTNPLIIGRTLYAYTADRNVVALDASSGKLLWKFDAGVHTLGAHRGLAWWSDGRESRLFAGVMNVLYALDPTTGKPITSFGDEGGVDLRQGVGDDPSQYFLNISSPGIVYRDLIIVGFGTVEVKPAPRGDIRAFDVHTGKLRWAFHSIPHPGEPGYRTWPKGAWRDAGAANCWAGFALDEQRGIVYVPTGSAAADFYGDDRIGDNLYANSLVALDAATGRRLWHFQGVHHDLWDRDFASPPVLVSVHRGGKLIDAVAQPSKQGFLFVLDRVTGKSLFPIAERRVPASDLPGERASPTQPFALAPAPLARQHLTLDMLTQRTPAAHTFAQEQFGTMRSSGLFQPLTVGAPTVVFPGFDGGAEWGGAAVDPKSSVLYVNVNDLAWSGSLATSGAGEGMIGAVYRAHCSTCHGLDRRGSPPAFPSLVDIAGHLSAMQITEVIRNGRGRMPAFPGIHPYVYAPLAEYLLSNGVEPAVPALAPGALSKREMTASILSAGKPVRYRFTGYDKFLDPDGYPAIVPPWGTLNAIDLNTGAYLWKIPLGYYPELAAQGMSDTGTENYGGPVITASGLLFIGATIFDHKLRAFDRDTGQLLWEHELPFAGTATPATYSIDGRQYLVIATSNARNPKAVQGNAYVAFALPDNPLRLKAHHATALVKDIDRAVRWYQGVLGFTLAERGARGDGAIQFAELKIAGYGVGLVQLRDALPGATAAAPSGWLHIVFTVPDADRAYRELKERRAEPYLRPGQPSAPVTSFLLHDSEGNEIEILEESP